MSDNNAIEAIRKAACFKPAKYTARNLLDLADEQGHVRLTYEAALTCTECETVVTLRTHLIALKAADVLTYHLNGAVDVTFVGFPPREIDESTLAERSFTRGERSKMIAHRASAPDDATPTTTPDSAPRAPSDHFRSLGDQKRSPSDHETPETDDAHYISACTHERAVGWLVGSNNQSDTENTNQPTNPETPPAGDLKIDPVQSAQTYALLLAIRMKQSNAKRFSAQVPFAQCRQYVAHWWYNRKYLGGRFADHPGILVTWLDSLENYPPDREYPLAMLAAMHQAAITAEERQQLDAESNLAAEMDADISDLESPRDEYPNFGEANKLWRLALEQIEKEIPVATFNTWVRDTEIKGLMDDGTLIIVAANALACEWLDIRLRQLIERVVSNLDPNMHVARIKCEIVGRRR